ncbi:MAG: VOC family protein [Halobacteriota archaeon]
MEIAHLCLNVADTDEVVEWYVENLDFEETWSWTVETEDGTVESRYVADPNGVELQIRYKESVEPGEPGTVWDHLGLVVDDVDAVVERIDHAGVLRGPEDNDTSGHRIAFVETPHGAILELMTPYEDL